MPRATAPRTTSTRRTNVKEKEPEKLLTSGPTHSWGRPQGRGKAAAARVGAGKQDGLPVVNTRV